MKYRDLKSFILLCFAISAFCPIMGQSTEQNHPNTLRNLDEIPNWIYKNIKFPEKAYQYGIAGVEQFVISATWDGRVFITSGLNTLNPAFEEEIKSIVSKAPRCRFTGYNIEDIYKLVKIDFTTYIPDDLPSSIQCIEQHLPPRFTLRGEETQYLKGKELFVEWMSSKFRLPKKYNLANYNDTISLYYTITEEGELKNARVEDCENSVVKSKLEKIMKRSPEWQPAITNKRMAIPISIKEKVIVRVDKYGTKQPFEIYTDDVCRNSTSAPTDPNMIVLNPEVQIQYAGNNKSFTETIHDSLIVEKQVKFIGSFVVEKNGTISNIYTETTDNIADSIITKLIKQSKWIPAQQGGEAVRAIYTFVGTQSPPVRYIYGPPPHKNLYQTRWKYFKKAYPGANTIINGATKFKYMKYSDYQEAMIMKGFPVVEIKKYKAKK